MYLYEGCASCDFRAEDTNDEVHQDSAAHCTESQGHFLQLQKSDDFCFGEKHQPDFAVLHSSSMLPLSHSRWCHILSDRAETAANVVFLPEQQPTVSWCI